MFLAADSIAEATKIFQREYEVGASLRARQFYAEQFAEIFREYQY